MIDFLVLGGHEFAPIRIAKNSFQLAVRNFELLDGYTLRYDTGIIVKPDNEHFFIALTVADFYTARTSIKPRGSIILHPCMLEDEISICLEFDASSTLKLLEVGEPLCTLNFLTDQELAYRIHFDEPGERHVEIVVNPLLN